MLAARHPYPRALPGLLAALAAIGVHLALWQGSYEVFSSSVDFNERPLEDFMGPYLETGRTVLESGEPAAGFLYSPLFAIALSVFRGVDPGVASWIWLVLELALTLGLVGLGLVLVQGRPPWLGPTYVFVALTSFPLVHNLHWGQVSVLLAALVLGAFASHLAGRRAAAALLLVLAASIKFYPALFLLYFVVREDWRLVGLSAALALALMGLIPALVLGPGATLDFYRTVFAGLERAGSEAWFETSNTQHLPAVLARWLGTQDQGARLGLGALGWLWAAVNLAVVRRLAGLGTRDGTLMAVALLALSLPLVVSPSWAHYFALLPFAQLVVARQAGREGLALALVGLSVVLSSAIFFRWTGTPQAYGRRGWLLAADLVLLLAVYRTLYRGPGRSALLDAHRVSPQ